MEDQDKIKRNLCVHVLRTVIQMLYDMRERFLLQILWCHTVWQKCD